MIDRQGSEPADVTVVICAHQEGTLAHYTLRSLRRSALHAVERGIAVRVVCVLDRPDEATRSFMTSEIGPNGDFAGLCSTSLVEVDFGDPGLSRNAGVAASAGAYVAMLDADNLPSENWLTESVRTLARGREPSVVHPELLVLFGERHEVLPQWASDDPRLRVENFYDCNYWDTACVADREIFESLPYAPTRGTTGFGYEDWHWNTRTLDAGIPHVVAERTALFYRVKPEGSVNASNSSSEALIPPSALLTDVRRAGPAAEQDVPREPDGEPDREPRRTRLQERIVRAWRRPGPDEVVVTGPTFARRLFGLGRASVVPDHYRLLYPEARDLSDRQVRAHYRDVGRSEGRRGRLTDSELAVLRPEVFQATHYRVLNADLADFSDAAAVRHYLRHGRNEGRRTLLTQSELEALERLDVEDYRLAHRDLIEASGPELVAHALRQGGLDGRQLQLTAPAREALSVLDRAEWLHAAWASAHQIEPRIPAPTRSALQGYRVIGPPLDGSLTPASRVWWRVVAEMGPKRPRAFFFAPWVEVGGAESAVFRYAAALAELRTDLDVVVVTTDQASTLPDDLPQRVRLLELPLIDGFAELTRDEHRELVGRMVVQYEPELVHVFDSAAAFDAVEVYPNALAHSSRVFLSTFAIEHGPEGELRCHLAKRRPEFLERVQGVIVDSDAFVEEMYDRFRHPREKFVVHHPPVDLRPGPSAPLREVDRPLNVLCAGYGESLQWLDVLADVVQACTAVDLPVAWHLYGGAPTAEDERTAPALARLARSGVPHERVLGEAALELVSYDALVITSETGELHPSAVRAMAAGVPVIAPMAGGMAEVLDHGTGFPISPNAAVNEYVEALAEISADPFKARERAAAAHELLVRKFSWPAFLRTVEATSGYLGPAVAPTQGRRTGFRA